MGSKDDFFSEMGPRIQRMEPRPGMETKKKIDRNEDGHKSESVDKQQIPVYSL